MSICRRLSVVSPSAQASRIVTLACSLPEVSLFCFYFFSGLYHGESKGKTDTELIQSCDRSPFKLLLAI